MHRLLFCVLLALNLPLGAADIRILPPGETPKDIRLGPPKDYDGYFPFTPYPTAEAWQQRAEVVRQQLRVALGIWPEPERNPLHAVIHGLVDRDDYTVERVSFESMPGYYVTGSLYRPKMAGGKPVVPGQKLPAILNPHGHWTDGRFNYASDREVKQLLESGAEKFESGARCLLQARPVQLARMGCIVFHYDMIGYADSQQLSFDLAHKFAKQRPEMNSAEGWGLYSPQAEARAQSIMGLQIWGGVRALDFLLSLPDVDPDRIGMTGASGGGTQTMLLSAIDPRIAVSCPAVMVSTGMQGGCTCENASLLRVETGNIEFAALFAPKPMAMTAANDWTKEMPTKGYPELQQHWAMLGAPDNVHLTALLQFPHNYNSVSRAAMDVWFNQHLHLGLSDEQMAERDFKLLTRDEMTVWDAEHPAPEGGPTFERKLLKWWNDDAQRQILKSPQEFARIAGPAIHRIIGRPLNGGDGIEWAGRTVQELGPYDLFTGLIRNTPHHEELPAVILRPKQWNGNVVIWLDPLGKAALFREEVVNPDAAKLLDAGACVIGVDLLEQGEFLRDGQGVQVRRVPNPRESGAYTFGYNPSLFAERTRDVLTVVGLLDRLDQIPAFSESAKGHPPRILLAAWGAAGPIGAAARAVADGAIAAAVLDSGAFRFANVNDLWSPDFLPAGAKYGDLPGLLALGAPSPLYVLGDDPPLLRAAYAAANAPSALQIGARPDRAAALDWLKESVRQPVTP
jgi:hypothetical protein